jgi:hypothetical protein
MDPAMAMTAARAHRLLRSASALLLAAGVAHAPRVMAADQIVAVFDEQPVEFHRMLPAESLAGGGDSPVRLLRNGQQIEHTVDLPAFPADLRDAQRIVATLIVEPQIIEVDGRVRPADPWTRLGSVTIGVDSRSPLAPTSQPSATAVAAGAPATRAESSTSSGQSDTASPETSRGHQPVAQDERGEARGDDRGFPVTTVAPAGDRDEAEIEIMRFVTPFGGPATYTADLTALAPLLTGRTSLRVWISTWKQPAWKVTLTLSYTDAGAGYRRPLFAQPIFNSEVTAEQRTLRASINIPRGLSRPRIRVLSTGHATDGAGGDEFISRSNVLRIDGREVASWRPWSEQGGPLREINPTAGRTEIDGRSLWASDLDRSGWHPGLIVEPAHIPLPELTPGRHLVELEIMSIRPKDQSGYGYWRVSAIIVADDPWPPSEDAAGPQ